MMPKESDGIYSTWNISMSPLRAGFEGMDEP